MTESQLPAESFPLPAGTVLPEGVIEGLTLTSYRVRTPEGETVFRPFSAVHYLPPATPLVVFR